jgi:hypothetical protein
MTFSYCRTLAVNFTSSSGHLLTLLTSDVCAAVTGCRRNFFLTIQDLYGVRLFDRQTLFCFVAVDFLTSSYLFVRGRGSFKVHQQPAVPKTCLCGKHCLVSCSCETFAFLQLFETVLFLHLLRSFSSVFC